MTLEFFSKNYNLSDYEIIKCEIKNNKLIIDVKVVAYLELIANGYRPEMNVNHEIQFSFNLNHDDYKFNNPIITNQEYKNGILFITINDNIIKISDNCINILQKE